MKNKLIKISVLSLAVITCVGITKVIAGNNGKETNNAKNDISKQKGVSWNPDKKEYYNSDSFTWDHEKQCYLPILKYSNQKLLSLSYTPADEEKWLTENKNSKNSIDIAIIEFNNKIKEENQKKPNLSSATLSIDDEAYNVFSNLSIDSLNEMLTKIKNNTIFSDLLRVGVQKMTKVKDSNLVINDNAKWLKEFNSKISSADNKIKYYSEKIKSGVDIQTENQIDEDIQSYGIFAAPYLLDELNNGNDKMMKYLPSSLENYCKDSKDNLSKKDKTYWQNILQNHKDDMNKLKNLTKAN
jgi:hypothetical protein